MSLKGSSLSGESQKKRSRLKAMKGRCRNTSRKEGHPAVTLDLDDPLLGEGKESRFGRTAIYQVTWSRVNIVRKPYC